MAKKIFDDTHIAAIAETIRSKLNSTDTYTTSQMPNAVNEACEAKTKAFWDRYQRKGDRTSYRNAFFDWYWNDTIYTPQYPIKCSGVSSEMMRYSEISDTKVEIYFSHNNSQYVFANNTYLKSIPFLSVTEAVTFTGWFNGCTALETVNMYGAVGNSIDFSPTKLNAESAVTILRILKDYSSQITASKPYICEIKFPTSLWTELDNNYNVDSVLAPDTYYPTWYDYLMSIGWKPNYEPN